MNKSTVPKIFTLTIAVLATALWGTNALTQTNRRTLDCKTMGFNNSGFLTTKWNNGRTYKEKVFLTRSNGAYYVRWDNSKDWIAVNLSGANFKLKRGNNWQLFTGKCTSWMGPFGDDGQGATNYREIVGSAFSYPDQVSGTFVLQVQ